MKIFKNFILTVITILSTQAIFAGGGTEATKQANDLLRSLGLSTSQVEKLRNEGPSNLVGDNQIITKALVSVVGWNKPEIVKELLSLKGANANSLVGSSGKTLLMFAAESGDTSMVQALLEAGANPNLKKLGSQKTAHDYAIENGYRDIITLLENASNAQR